MRKVWLVMLAVTSVESRRMDELAGSSLSRGRGIARRPQESPWRKSACGPCGKNHPPAHAALVVDAWLAPHAPP